MLFWNFRNFVSQCFGILWAADLNICKCHSKVLKKYVKKAIKMLHNQIGTMILTSSGSNDELSDSSDAKIGSEINQNDATFPKDYDLKTNVISLIGGVISIWHLVLTNCHR